MEKKGESNQEKSKGKLTANKSQKLNSGRQTSLITQQGDSKNMNTIDPHTSNDIEFNTQTEMEMYRANQ